MTVMMNILISNLGKQTCITVKADPRTYTNPKVMLFKSQGYSPRSRIPQKLKGDSRTNTQKQKLTLIYPYLPQEFSSFLNSLTHAHKYTHILKIFSTRRHWQGSEFRL